MSVPQPSYVYIPCHQHGGIGDAAGCQTCLDSTLPPNEDGIEVTGSDAFAALDEAFKEMTGPARAHLSVKDIGVKKLGRWITLTVKFKGKKSNEVTIRMPRAWASVLSGRLAKVLR